ncbi:hypothetical protein VTO58DRAFT_111628 [Aureobasidium pullulans]
MNGLTAFPEVLGLVLSLSSCVQYTSAAAIAIASTESNRVPHPADITDSHVKPTEVVNLRSTISAASLNWAIIPTINPDHLSWLERDRSSSTASGPSAASATTNVSSKTPTASSEAAVSSDDFITRTIATRWPDSVFDTNLPVPRPLTETPEYVVVTLIKNHIAAEPRTTEAISTSGADVTTIVSFAPGIEVMTTTIIRGPCQWPNPIIFPPRPPWVDKEITEIITWTKTHSSTASGTTATVNLSSSGISSSVANDSKTLDLTVSYRYYPSTVTHSPYVYGVGRTTYTRTYTHTETLMTAITNSNAAISNAIIASTDTPAPTISISISLAFASDKPTPTTFATQVQGKSAGADIAKRTLPLSTLSNDEC